MIRILTARQIVADRQSVEALLAGETDWTEDGDRWWLAELTALPSAVLRRERRPSHRGTLH